ncbi:sialidase family protein [Conexibacter woesei]|uniref:sialidase family protein n=1 Tax=Conexibacter woesei TaxID=191495 RepID=UPI0004198674|nr:sialidase family protein [Conexibacter woesei]
MQARRRTSTLFCALLVAILATLPVASAAHAADVRVNHGADGFPFGASPANEPAVAIDPIHPSVIAAGSNDNVDQPACNSGDDHDCNYSQKTGTSGIYFSSNAGLSWAQPTYSGITGRACRGVVGDSDPECVESVGPIGTLPNYSEIGMRDDGDPGVAWGPRPDAHGHFSWANGSRLYYVNLSGKQAGWTGPDPFPGYEAVAVSRMDNLAAAQAGSDSAWSAPVITSAQTPDTFSDKPQIWADNASSSAHFGNVYVCSDPYIYDPVNGTFDVPPIQIATSHDGGVSWSQSIAIDKHYEETTQPGYSRVDCTVRTDSHGKVYVFAYQQPPQAPGAPVTGQEVMVTSSDGGATWTAPVKLFDANDQCAGFEVSVFRCTIDGVGGERNDAGAGPSVDIANGAPFGAGATNQIVMSYADGGSGLGAETVKFTTSRDGGATWGPRRSIQSPGDRGYYSAAAISPDARDAYVVYNAFTAPFTTSAEGPENAHPSVGVMLHANIGPLGVVGPFSVANRGASGDARGSSANNLASEFVGDYVYADATRTYGIGLWNDVRNAADCPAVDEYRQELHEEAVSIGGPTSESPEPPTELPNDSGDDDEDEGSPAPQQDCPANFGNADIYASTVFAP